MKSVVFIKQITRFDLHTGIDAATNDLSKDGAVLTINPYDEVALEEALRIREHLCEGDISIVTLGPESAKEALFWGLAMGADHAIHVLNKEEPFSDPWITARLLSEAIIGKKFDLYFFGRIALDDGLGQVGTFFAEMNGLPVVTAVSGLEIIPAKGIAIVKRVLERGHQEEVQTVLPAVFTTDISLNLPRYPTFPGRKRAAATELLPIDGNILEYELNTNDPTIEIRQISPPKVRPKKILAPDSGLSAASRMRFIMSGGRGQKSGGKLAGDPEQMAKGIFDYLKENRFLQKHEDGTRNREQ